jgi:hypothetical protein
MGLFKTDPQAAEKKSLVEAQEQLAKAPNDVRVLMRVAELEHKLGMAAEAGSHYARAASRYAEEGFLLKAVAVNKVAFGLCPTSAELLEREAEFYAELELIIDAFESLKRAIQLHEQRGDTERAFAARRKLLAIDPDNAAGRVAEAEFALAKGKVAEALDALAKVAVQLHLEGKTEPRDKVNARLTFLKRKYAGQ